jgi:hypothetical protein
MEHNKEEAEAADFGFKVVTGCRYLGGFIGEKADQKLWVEAQAARWVDAVVEISKVAERYPQTAYARMQKSLQQEWQFLQRVTDGLDDEFAAIEHAVNAKFLPPLFGIESVCDTKRQLGCLPVKHSGLALPDPTTTAESNWKASTLVCGHLVAALREHTDFRSADHASIMAQGKAEIRKLSQEAYGKYMETILATIPAGKSRTIRRGMETGAWLSVLPSTVSGTELSAQEFRDALHPTFQLDAMVVMPQHLPFSTPSRAKRVV